MFINTLEQLMTDAGLSKCDSSNDEGNTSTDSNSGTVSNNSGDSNSAFLPLTSTFTDLNTDFTNLVKPFIHTIATCDEATAIFGEVMDCSEIDGYRKSVSFRKQMNGIGLSLIYTENSEGTHNVHVFKNDFSGNTTEERLIECQHGCFDELRYYPNGINGFGDENHYWVSYLADGYKIRGEIETKDSVHWLANVRFDYNDDSDNEKSRRFSNGNVYSLALDSGEYISIKYGGDDSFFPSDTTTMTDPNSILVSEKLRSFNLSAESDGNGSFESYYCGMTTDNFYYASLTSVMNSFFTGEKADEVYNACKDLIKQEWPIQWPNFDLGQVIMPN